MELHSVKHLKTLNIPSSGDDAVVVEGTLGKLQAVCLVEDSMLEIQGEHGTLRIDMDANDFKKLFQAEVKT